MQIMSAVDFIKSYVKFVDARRIMNILCRKPLTCGIGGLKMKNVECPYCHVREDRQIVETGQVSVGKPMQMYKFKCDGCGRYFWKNEKVQR